MCFKRLFRGLGRLVGKLLRETYHGFKRGFKYICIGLFIMFGIFLTFLGNVIVLALGFLLTLCLYFLKGFAWFTRGLMMTTKFAGEKVGEFTDSFLEGITSVFQQEQEHLEREINLVIHTEKL